MKRLLIMGTVFLLLFLTACSQSQPQQQGLSQEEERRLLEQAAEEYLNSSQADSEDASPPAPLSEVKWQEDGNGEVYTEDTERIEEDDPEASSSDSDSRSSSNLDIRVRDVDISGYRNFDLGDDAIRFQVDIDTIGIDDDEGFIVEVLMRKSGVDSTTCSFIYVVGGDKDNHECEIDDLEEYGTYDIEVYADTKHKFEEDDLSNNLLRDEVDVEE